MKKRFYFLLFLAAFVVNLTAALLQPVPGYMDADYYYAGGMQLANGKGFNESFIWNYLDNPQGIPHPSNTYWMPLASIVAAVGMVLTRSTNFLSARLFLILLAGLIPPITAAISYSMSQRLESSLLAGILAISSGFYLLYTSDTETFAIYMVFGGLFLLVANRLIQSRQPSYLYFFLLGLIAGIMHLTRADGIMWFGMAGVVSLWQWMRHFRLTNLKNAFLHGIEIFGCVSVGYLVLMSPWYFRNINLYSSLFSPAGQHTLWLTDYNQMFNYPADQLNFSDWINTGLWQALQVRVDALIANLETLLAVQGEIFLLPLMFLGIWRMKNERCVQLGLGMWLITLLIMTFIFPFAGKGGGFFHSGAAVQPLLWALAPIGLDVFIALGIRRRNWNQVSAPRIFGLILVVIAILITTVLFYQRVLGNDPGTIAWNFSWNQYREDEKALIRLGATPDSIVIVDNPPGYFVANGRPSVVTPNGDEQTLFEVARRYGASYLILESNHVYGLNDLYWHPGDRPGLKYLTVIGPTYLYKILQSP